jgi:ribonucleotide monophosphatase NagD (HAD superfamily)
MTAILVDLDGVVYQGDSAVPGALRTLDWVRQRDLPHLFLTNTTSRPRSAIVEKLSRMDIRVSEDEILSPPVAAKAWLNERGIDQVALFVPEATREELAGLSALSEESESGAQACGIKGFLMRTGKFRDSDLEGEIKPDAVLDSFADLPHWWRVRFGTD